MAASEPVRPEMRAVANNPLSKIGRTTRGLVVWPAPTNFSITDRGHRPPYASYKRQSLLKLLNPQVAEPNFGSMAAKADMAAVARQTGVSLAIKRAVLAGLRNIRIDNRLTVENH